MSRPASTVLAGVARSAAGPGHLVPLLAAIAVLAAVSCSATTAPGDDTTPFTLTSPAFRDGGALPVRYTCDGVGLSPPLAWSGAPAGTVEFALLMTTLAPDGMKWNWVLYGIPASATSLAEGATDVGVFGLTSDGPDLAYSPPCSQGPGAKTYTFTLYALSAPPVLSVAADQVTGSVLASAISQVAPSSSSLSVTYTR